MTREHHLDGLRGLAAIIVAIFHFGRSFMPGALGKDQLVNFTPVSLLWNGHFAVVVFFALSGLLFFGKCYEKPLLDGSYACVKRYVRLSVPVLVVSLAAWLLHASGWFFNVAAGRLSGSDWLPRWFEFPPSLSFAVGEPLLWMYADFSCSYTYNCNLWTIRYELFVIWLVIALAVAMRLIPRTYHWPTLLLFLALSIGSYAFQFLAGSAIALLLISRPNSVRWSGTMLVFACSIGLASFHSWIPRAHWLWPFAAAGIIWGVSGLSAVRAFFSHSLFRFFGDLSFGVYLIHFVTLASVASWTYIHTRSVALTFVAYAFATVVAAWAFSRLVDKPLMALLSKWRPESRVRAITASS